VALRLGGVLPHLSLFNLNPPYAALTAEAIAIAFVASHTGGYVVFSTMGAVLFVVPSCGCTASRRPFRGHRYSLFSLVAAFVFVAPVGVLIAALNRCHSPRCPFFFRQCAIVSPGRRPNQLPEGFPIISFPNNFNITFPAKARYPAGGGSALPLSGRTFLRGHMKKGFSSAVNRQSRRPRFSAFGCLNRERMWTADGPKS